MNLNEALSQTHRSRVTEIKNLLQVKEVDVDALQNETIQDLTQWLGLPPAHKHRLLTANGDQRKTFLDSVLRWTILVLQQEANIKDGFFPN